MTSYHRDLGLNRRQSANTNENQGTTHRIKLRNASYRGPVASQDSAQVQIEFDVSIQQFSWLSKLCWLLCQGVYILFILISWSRTSWFWESNIISSWSLLKIWWVSSYHKSLSYYKCPIQYDGPSPYLSLIRWIRSALDGIEVITVLLRWNRITHRSSTISNWGEEMVWGNNQIPSFEYPNQDASVSINQLRIIYDSDIE